MYCINCGVKLEDTESRCPLCGVTVYHPELTRQTAEPLYPRHRYPAPEAASKAAHIVVSTLMAIALLTTVFIDLQINGTVSWGGIAAGGIVVAYVVLVMPFWFRRVQPLAYVPCVFSAIALYLWYICHVTGGSWFLGLGLPVTVYLGILLTVQVYLLRRYRNRILTILGCGLIAMGVLMVLVEYWIHTTFAEVRFVAWSVYPLISLSGLGAMLLFLAVNRKARERMERKFFI